MLPTRNGSVKLFRLAGIDVYVHWLWFVVAFWWIGGRNSEFSSLTWSVIEYLCVFLIVLMHEFGHSLACRSVGGQSNLIVLWLLGGVSYSSPPRRPGAVLWTIAAGPLVNVALLPVFVGAWYTSQSLGWPDTHPDLYKLLFHLCFIDAFLFCFNILPIYPLDGGQILQSLLWFIVGEARSLMIASVVGIIGLVAMFGVAFVFPIFSTLSIGTAIFVLLSCWGGLKRARALARLAEAPRHENFACPACGESPPQGEFWRCQKCRALFDTFATGATCPQCGTQYPSTACVRCGKANPIEAWMKPPAS